MTRDSLGEHCESCVIPRPGTAGHARLAWRVVRVMRDSSSLYNKFCFGEQITNEQRANKIQSVRRLCRWWTCPFDKIVMQSTDTVVVAPALTKWDMRWLRYPQPRQSNYASFEVAKITRHIRHRRLKGWHASGAKPSLHLSTTMLSDVRACSNQPYAFAHRATLLLSKAVP